MPDDQPLKPEGNVTDRVFEVLEESTGITKRQTKTFGKRALRYLKMAGLMGLSAIVIPVALISTGLAFGWGFKSFVLSPVAVLTAWGVILFVGLRRRATPGKIARAPLSDLAQQLLEYLESSRRHLPPAARGTVEGILQHIEDMEPALYLLKEEPSPMTNRIRRLLAEDLTGLIDHYRRLPPHLRQKKLHGGPTPEQQLLSGLSTIRVELGRVNEALAKEDLSSLAAKERYLDMKYGSGTNRPS